MENRIEKDSFGPIEVPADHLWGAQTQRSLHHFHISTERMAPELVAALAQVKRAAAAVNRSLGKLPADKAEAIIRAADEVLEGRHPQEFPLAVWQTGSGTQSNMNMNEVLANRGSELMGGERGEKRLLHPNDHVNMGQSSNDIFPTAMHVAAAIAAATCMAVGKMSFEDWPMLTWSFGCSRRFSPRSPPISSEPRLASTSFMFMLLWVPEPVCQTASGNSCGWRPSSTSSAARMMASALSAGSLPSERFTAAAARLTWARAATSSGAMRSVEMWKWWSERWVWAPQRWSAGTSIGPKLSFSILFSMLASCCGRQ